MDNKKASTLFFAFLDFEGLRETFYNNAKFIDVNGKYNIKLDDNPEDFVTAAFPWRYSKEGTEFWARISRRWKVIYNAAKELEEI